MIAVTQPPAPHAVACRSLSAAGEAQPNRNCPKSRQNRQSFARLTRCVSLAMTARSRYAGTQRLLMRELAGIASRQFSAARFVATGAVRIVRAASAAKEQATREAAKEEVAKEDR